MRILFDSKNKLHKDPFGCLTPGQICALQLHIPTSVGTVGAECILCWESGEQKCTFPFHFQSSAGAYDIWQGQFSIDAPGLYFYYFRIEKPSGSFRLFKQGDDTNMEAGDLWQLSCLPEVHTTPDWAKGAVIYQIFPDRFCKAGECDLTGKLTPYTLHSRWNEEVAWQPDAQGRILNNDFYGGNFRGIAQKLDYIASLGVSILYLNPISKSFSSHRYDTGDYKTPDPMLGTAEDFSAMCRAAHNRGIRVILDGVFSHTGDNSLYFDRQGAFGGKGAYAEPNSPYRSWYTFYEYPNRYHCWWNFDTLPTVNKLDPAFLDYIIRSEDSVIAHWLKLGADGFRLDVADELPNEFMDILKKRLRQLKPDALLIGEVWEDASNKIAYGIRRRYFTDGTLDSVMNYPFRTAILNFFRKQDDGSGLKETVMSILENYPAQVIHCNMNLLSTHDTPRILTALVDDFDGPREALAQRSLSYDAYALAVQRLLAASFLQYTLPGAPSLYYGDEAGMEGHKDPFNRRTYPWGSENQELLQHFCSLGALRKEHPALRIGDTAFFHAGDGKIGFCRTYQDSCLKIYVNLSDSLWDIPSDMVLMGHNLQTVSRERLCLGAMGFCITEEQ